MSYNLQSLITILQQILDPKERRRDVNPENEAQLESLLKKAASLQQILERSSLPKIESLESQIREAAHKAEDIIESDMVDQMLPTSLIRWFITSCNYFTFSTTDLQQVTQELDSAMEQEVKLIKGKSGSTSSSSSGASCSPNPSSKSIVVGVDEDLLQLKDRLTGMQRKLEIIPIVGMGGIGKTTLARKLYQDPFIVEHFTSLAWTTISPDHNMKAILSGLLSCITGEEFDEHIDKLKDRLYRNLYGTRYLIVLDDIWSTQAWDDLRRYFPDNNNGSRIVITTRESNVAKYADSQSLHHQMQLLSKSMSWNLLRQIVFGEEDCPCFLQEMGEKIASDCGGLPLAINVIGGLLSTVERSKDAWEKIANDVSAAIVDSDDQFSNILSLSYNHLPNHLKPCFLYMGAFTRDYEMKGSRLVCMWIAEGFVKSNGDNTSLEEEAKDYLNALVERNLISVRRRTFEEKPNRYTMHDLLRDLCARKADEEKFLHVIKNAPNVEFSNMRRLSLDGLLENVFASAEFMTRARSLLCTKEGDFLSHTFHAPRLLRVLDVMEVTFIMFPVQIFQLVNLRYLALTCKSALPAGISTLSNLQTLIAALQSG